MISPNYIIKYTDSTGGIMKLFKITSLLIISVIICSCATTSGDIVDMQTLFDPASEVKLETISFDDGELLPIYNSGSIIGFYERYDNKSYSVYSAKIYSNQKELLYSIVPTETKEGKIVIHIKNRDDQRGNIEITKKALNLLQYDYNIIVNYYNQPFNLTYSFREDMSGSRSEQYMVLRDSTPFLGYSLNKKYTYLYEKPTFTESIYSSSDSSSRPNDVSFWTVCTKVINEVNEIIVQREAQEAEQARLEAQINKIEQDSFLNNNNTNNTGGLKKWNNDGTVDNNHNPFDSF